MCDGCGIICRRCAGCTVTENRVLQYMMTEAHRNDETNGLRLFHAVVGRLEVVNAHDSFEPWIAVILYPLCSKYVLRA